MCIQIRIDVFMCIPTPLVAPTPQASLKQVSFGQVYMCWNPCIRVCVCVCVCVYVKSWASHMTSRQISSTSPLRRSLACIVWFISHLKWVVSPHGWVMSHYKWVTSRHERVTWHLDRFQQRRRYGDRLSSRNGRRATNKPSSLKERTVSRLPKS